MGAIRSEVKIKRLCFYHEGHEYIEEEMLLLLLYPSLTSCPSWLKISLNKFYSGFPVFSTRLYCL